LTTKPSVHSNLPHTAGRLLKVLGMWFGMAAAIGNAIAGRNRSNARRHRKKLAESLALSRVWVVGGLYALFGGFVDRRNLALRFPAAAASIIFRTRSRQLRLGFVVGWSDWLSTCGTAAAVAIVISEYSVTCFPFSRVRKKIKILSVAIIAGFGILQ